MSVYGDLVLEHFRRPRNRHRLAVPDLSAEGANPLCGDRIRVEVRLDGDRRITEAAFTADACAFCVASASLLTEHVRGLASDVALGLDETAVLAWVGEVPEARIACAVLPVTTLRRALSGAIGIA